jgi:hypothetical protein
LGSNPGFSDDRSVNVCLKHVKALGYGYIGARTDTTQQSGQTPDKEVEIKNIIVYVSCYTETDTTAMLVPPTVWRFSAVDTDSNVFDSYFLIWSLSRLLCCVGSGFNVAAVFISALSRWR